MTDIAAALGALALPALPTALGEALFLPEHGAKRVVALHLDRRRRGARRDAAGGLGRTARRWASTPPSGAPGWPT